MVTDAIQITCPSLAATVIGELDKQRQVALFRGIPYAKVEKRWTHSCLKDTLDNPFQATNFGPRCVQDEDPVPILSGGGVDPETGNDEFNCLNLNLALPSKELPGTEGPRPTSLLPVMVWIHGGAFQFGANSIARDHPARFCAFAGQIGMPIVLVQINYRLGPFGFAASSDLATEGAGGNYGFVDQQNAFKWVQNHIQDFGGDPCNVTAFGVSAGSASVHYHILSGEARFDRGIMMSGAASTLGPLPLELHQQDWEGLCRRGHLQGRSAQARLEELRSLSAAEILQSARFRASGPIADGRVLPSWRYKASVPVSRCKSLIAGDTHTEAVIFDRLIDATPQDNFHRLVDSYFSQIHAEAFLKAFHFTSKSFPPELYRSTMRDFLSAAVFQFPHLAALEAFGPVGESYLYHFEEPWPVEGPLQGLSYHGQCTLLMFMNEEDTLPVQTQSVGKELARRWIAFAHGKMPWTSFAAEDQVFMRFGDKAQCRETTLKDDDTRQYGHLEWLRDNFEEVVAFVQGLLFNRT